MAIVEPILLTGFNRPGPMRTVIDRLREIQPTKLFVAVDGPRSNSPSDAELVRQCRDLIAEIDWTCELRTLIQDRNLGCGLGMSTAISWFFDHVERGIILEDDISPHPAFFDFCAELLDRYADDDRVFAIAGCNLVPAKYITDSDAPYRFSRIPTVWGWATWRRTWANYQLDIREWWSEFGPSRLARALDWSPTMLAFWATEFELTGRGNVDTWDWQLTYAAMRSDQLVATSNVNLVENIGFGTDATHTRGEGPKLESSRSISLPLDYVPVAWDRKADEWVTRNHFGGSVLTAVDRLRQYLTSPTKVIAPWR